MNILQNIFDTSYFGIILSFFAYKLGMWVQKKTKFPLFNPLLLGIIFCIIFLKATGATYEQYMKGASYISFLVAPATVGLVVALYRNLDRLKANLVPILTGIICGTFVAVFGAVLLSKLAGFDTKMTASLAPQSVTTAIALSLVEEYGGSTGIAAVVVVLRGVAGAAYCQVVLKLVGITDPVAKGVAIGTASHAVGTSKAIEIGEVEGAMSGLSIALAGITTVFVMPLAMALLN